MTSAYSVEVAKMPFLLCTGCGKRMEVNIGTHPLMYPSDPARLIGSAFCRNCEVGTGFELQDNIMTYVAGKISYGELDSGLSDVTKKLYAEAELCFQSGAANASATMCRASIESALADAGVEGKTLFDMITNAKEKILDDIEVTLAHGSRLITRDAIHRSELVQLSDVPSMLSATVRILNKSVKPEAQ